MTATASTGKIALVTGGSGGIGAAIARRLANDGAHVVVHYNSGREAAEGVVRDIAAAGGAARAVGGDLGSRDGAASVIAQLDAAFDGRFEERLDLLVNNAGQFEFGTLVDTTDDDFDRVFAVNVRAIFVLSRVAAARMTAAGWGRIVNIGSVFGAAVPSAALDLYSPFKFAVAGFTRAWSRELGPAGITVNCVQPALIQTQPAPAGGASFEAMERFASVGRFGTPDEIARAVAFLASPAAAFINGATLNVDGGWSA